MLWPIPQYPQGAQGVQTTPIVQVYISVTLPIFPFLAEYTVAYTVVHTRQTARVLMVLIHFVMKGCLHPIVPADWLVQFPSRLHSPQLLAEVLENPVAKEQGVTQV